ncbi:MAG TPA: hypothetical protein DGG95_17750 [Cytophagales bacterium]|jgi:LmbE family N-acetylglucosaminyl deacetylase|nr:hypothetical protein [Cytophagales bacterium]
MKKIALISIVAIVVALLLHVTYLFTLKPSEKYSDDTFLNTVTEKRLLIIEAHDDDAISCAGTIAKLAQEGWTIDYITFYGRWHKEEHEMRKSELQKACAIQGIHQVERLSFDLQKTDTVKKPWMPIPYNQFNEYYNLDSLRSIIQSKMKSFQPTILFTTDNVIGGYGHPEHVALSQAVIDVCKKLKENGELPAQKIYQAVFTPTQAENTIGDMTPFQQGKKIYGCKGMPEPTIQIDISSSASKKKMVMETYVSQQGPIKKVWPYYNWYPSWIYFKVFDKEFFRVLEL